MNHQDQIDPYGMSYPTSAAQYFWYRIFILCMAVTIIILGKNNMPADEVACIEDVTLDIFLPISKYFLKNITFGIVIQTLCRLIVDIQFIALVIYWNLYSKSFRLPIVLIIFGILKILMTFLFQTKPIVGSFNYQSPVPSLLISQQFQYDYFFSGQTGFLLIAALEWKNMDKKIFSYISYGFCIFVSLMTLFLRQNYSMDIFTGLITGHLLYSLVNEYQKQITKFINVPYKYIISKMDIQE